MDPYHAESMPDDALGALMQQGAVLSSRLERVIAIGQTVEDRGVTVELICLEIRGLGSILHWRAQGIRAQVHGGPDFHVEDNEGTRYQVALPSWTSSEGLASGTTVLVPLPPPDSTSIRVVAHRIGQPAFLRAVEGMGDSIDGLWAFGFELV